MTDAEGTLLAKVTWRGENKRISAAVHLAELYTRFNYIFHRIDATGNHVEMDGRYMTRPIGRIIE